MIDFNVQRRNMVESQIRPSDVTDRRILRAFAEVPRELFVPESARSLAYMDADIALDGNGGPRPARALLAPRTLAKLLQLAEFGDTDIVLDIGCATGYSAAIIARMAAAVFALESDPRLAAEAEQTLRRLAVANATVVRQDLTAGYPGEGPFDVIVLEGAVAEVPPALLDQMKDGGRLVAVHMDGPVGRGTLWRRLGQAFDRVPAFDAGASLLPGFEKAPAFVF